MPFTPETKNPGDLVKSQDWNEAMNAIVALFAKFNESSGHQHTGAVEDAPPIQQNGLADNAVTENKIQNGAITTAKLGDLAVSTDKIQDAAVTFNKIAPGAVPNIGIAVTQGLAGGASIPLPSGFIKTECMFFVIPKLLNTRDGDVFICQTSGIDPSMVIATPEGKVTVTAVAIAKKGGW